MSELSSEIQSCGPDWGDLALSGSEQELRTVLPAEAGPLFLPKAKEV